MKRLMIAPIAVSVVFLICLFFAFPNLVSVKTAKKSYDRSEVIQIEVKNNSLIPVYADNDPCNNFFFESDGRKAIITSIDDCKPETVKAMRINPFSKIVVTVFGDRYEPGQYYLRFNYKTLFRVSGETSTRLEIKEKLGRILKKKIELSNLNLIAVYENRLISYAGTIKLENSCQQVNYSGMRNIYTNPKEVWIYIAVQPAPSITDKKCTTGGEEDISGYIKADVNDKVVVFLDDKKIE